MRILFRSPPKRRKQHPHRRHVPWPSAAPARKWSHSWQTAKISAIRWPERTGLPAASQRACAAVNDDTLRAIDGFDRVVPVFPSPLLPFRSRAFRANPAGCTRQTARNRGAGLTYTSPQPARLHLWRYIPSSSNSVSKSQHFIWHSSQVTALFTSDVNAPMPVYETLFTPNTLRSPYANGTSGGVQVIRSRSVSSPHRQERPLQGPNCRLRAIHLVPWNSFQCFAHFLWSQFQTLAFGASFQQGR